MTRREDRICRRVTREMDRMRMTLRASDLEIHHNGMSTARFRFHQDALADRDLHRAAHILAYGAALAGRWIELPDASADAGAQEGAAASGAAGTGETPATSGDQGAPGENDVTRGSAAGTAGPSGADVGEDGAAETDGASSSPNAGEVTGSEVGLAASDPGVQAQASSPIVDGEAGSREARDGIAPPKFTSPSHDVPVGSTVGSPDAGALTPSASADERPTGTTPSIDPWVTRGEWQGLRFSSVPLVFLHEVVGDPLRNASTREMARLWLEYRSPTPAEGASA